MRLDKEESDLISDEELDEGALEGDTWIEELECALLADCDPAILKKISDGKKIPASLRPDFWKALLALTDTNKFNLTSEYDLENQLEIRQDCENLVEDIAADRGEENRLTDAEKLQLRSNFESTLTTYVKARPELEYISDNGWIDILRVLNHLELNESQLYQMFFRIVDRYIPKDLSHKTHIPAQTNPTKGQSHPVIQMQPSPGTPVNGLQNQPGPSTAETSNSSLKSSSGSLTSGKSVQAYHLLRLLIQYHDPELCSLLDSRKVTPMLYVKDWFCSLFARSCETKLALKIWDTHFKMADPFLIFFAAIVMVANASDELKKGNKTQTEMLQVLKSMPKQLVEDDIEDLYYLVSNHYTYSTPRSIRSYSHLFFMDTFGATYTGNENLEESQSAVVDLNTIQLTTKLDLSRYLCLPIVPAEIFAIDTAQMRSSSGGSPTSTPLKYFLVDCRPAEQYNSGHLNRAFHLDCSLMLREPSSFKTAVQALLEIQRQVVASKSNTGGQHLCFIGSGHEEEDQYVNMVVASFLQKHQKYVSIVVGGFEAVHDYAAKKGELKDSFDKYIVDHNAEHCKVCCLKTPGSIEGLRSTRGSLSSGVGGFSSAQSLLASTTSFLRGDKGVALGKLVASGQAGFLTQSGSSMFDKFTSAFVSKSNEFKDRLVETLNTSAIPMGAVGLSAGYSSQTGRGHVSSTDKSSRRYMGSGKEGETRYAIDDSELIDKSSVSGLNTSAAGGLDDSDFPSGQEFQIDSWQKENKPLAFYKCSQIKGSARHPGYVALTSTHLIILREIPHNKNFATIVAERPLEMIVQITSKGRQIDHIIFRYGNVFERKAGLESKEGSEQGTSKASSNKASSDKIPIIASDHLHIPEAFELIRLAKREIVRNYESSLRRAKAETATTTKDVDKKSQPEESN